MTVRASTSLYSRVFIDIITNQTKPSPSEQRLDHLVFNQNSCLCDGWWWWFSARSSVGQLSPRHNIGVVVPLVRHGEAASELLAAPPAVCLTILYSGCCNSVFQCWCGLLLGVHVCQLWSFRGCTCVRQNVYLSPAALPSHPSLRQAWGGKCPVTSEDGHCAAAAATCQSGWEGWVTHDPCQIRSVKTVQWNKTLKFVLYYTRIASLCTNIRKNSI